MKIEAMTLAELREEEQQLIKILEGDKATWTDAKKFNMICNAISHITLMKGFAAKLAKGKTTEAQSPKLRSLAPKPLNEMSGVIDAAMKGGSETSNSSPA